MRRLVLFLFTVIWTAAASAQSPFLVQIPEDQLPDDTVLMSRGDVTVSYADWKAHLRSMPEEGRGDIVSNPALMAQVMDSLWTWKNLAHEARKNGFDEDPDARADVAYAAEKALGRAWLYDARQSAAPADYSMMAREHYIVNPQDYRTEETVRVFHILISSQNRPEEEALALAEEVRGLILAGEQTIDELALAYSEDASVAQNRGHLEPQPRGKWTPPFEDAAFALTEGQISEPVQTHYGYHVIVLEERIPGEKVPFEQVEEVLMVHFEFEYRDRFRLRRAEAAADVTGRELNVGALRTIMPLGAMTASQVFEQSQIQDVPQNGD